MIQVIYNLKVIFAHIYNLFMEKHMMPFDFIVCIASKENVKYCPN